MKNDLWVPPPVVRLATATTPRRGHPSGVCEPGSSSTSLPWRCDLGFLFDALRLFDAGPSVDVVIGTKRGAGARDRRGPGRRAVTGALRHGFGLRTSDTHGPKMLPTGPLRPLVDQVRSSGDLFDTELVLRAERAGLLIQEIPVTVEERRPARTPIAARVVRSLFGLARLRVLLWRGGPGGAAG